MQLLVKPNQLLPKTEQYYTFSIIRDVIDVQCKLNLALISLNFRELFTFHVLRKLTLS